MKESNSSKNAPEARYTAVIIEEMRSQFKAVTENFVALRKDNAKEHAAIHKRLDMLTDGLADVRVKLAITNERIAKIEERITKLEERITKIEESNARIESDIRLIKNGIRAKVDLEEFKVLENRLVILERKFAASEK